MELLQPINKEHEHAFNEIIAFLADPKEQFFILEGYGGTGKTTLLKMLLNRLPSINEVRKMVNPAFELKEVVLSAMNNDAAQAVTRITGVQADTIHGVLGLKLEQNYAYTEQKLILKDDAQIIENKIIVVDEISQDGYPDKAEFPYATEGVIVTFLRERTRNCKIILVGDPCQLIDMKDDYAPAFAMKCPRAKLSTIIRTDHEPIAELSAMFREAVITGVFRKFKPDGQYVKHLSRPEFERELLSTVRSKSWKPTDGRLLAWRNKRVQYYNQHLNKAITGWPTFQVGDHAVTNGYVKNKNCSVRNAQTVLITAINECPDQYSLPGKIYEVDGRHKAFMPDSTVDKASIVKSLKLLNDQKALRDIGQNWIDMRHSYASTVNKAQGSTYNQSFTDIDDIAGCWKVQHKARLLYVAVSRASQQVVMTGDIIQR